MALQYLIVQLQSVDKTSPQELLFSSPEASKALRFLDNKENDVFSGKDLLLLATSVAQPGKMDISSLLDQQGKAFDPTQTMLLATKVGTTIIYINDQMKQTFQAIRRAREANIKQQWASRRK